MRINLIVVGLQKIEPLRKGHIMAQSVIVKKDEKIAEVASSLPPCFTDEQFISSFIETFPKDWARINKVYEDHERRTKSGKTHPMPHPKQYLINALKTWRNKNQNNK